jgi:hypothetical protein
MLSGVTFFSGSDVEEDTLSEQAVNEAAAAVTKNNLQNLFNVNPSVVYSIYIICHFILYHIII